MKAYHTHTSILSVWLRCVIVMSMALFSHPNTANAATVDCAKIISEAKSKDIKMNPDEVQQCIKLGWDAPLKLRPEKLSNAPGARGFSYGGTQSPANSPGKLKVKASVSKEVITSSCNFPPKIKIGFPPKITFQKGSCYDFLNDVFKDKKGATNSAPAPTGIEPSSCPAEDDKTGLYGIKQPLTGQSSAAAQCGGMMPLTTTNIVLNANPDGLAAAEEGAYYLWYYKKTGSGFSLATPNGQPVSLPKYLCKLVSQGDSEMWVKSVDLTAPTAQMITFNSGGQQEIKIRLRSRETMDANFIPPYNEEDPEKFLVIPLDANGVPQVPNDCADDAQYFKEADTREDIYIESATIGGCESLAASPTTSIEYTYSCTTGTVSGTKCVDQNTGAELGPATRSAPIKVDKCPGDVMPVNGVCPQSPGTPNTASYLGCEKGVLSGNSCVDGSTGAVVGTPITVSGEGSCSTSAASTGANCDVVTTSPKGGICDGKTQYAVIDRPNLYYPPGTNTSLYRIDGRTALLAATVANSTLYTQSQTIFHLQPTAPTITLTDGGFIDLDSGDILIMSPAATINPATRQVTMNTGGQLASSGGTQKQAFANGETYTLPGTGTIEVRVGRSVVLPAGFLYPTMPGSPYLRHPIDKLPE